MGKGKGIGLGGTGEQGRYNQNTSHKILWEQILKFKGEKKSNMNQKEFSVGPEPGNQVNTVELLCVAPGIPALRKWGRRIAGTSKPSWAMQYNALKK